MIVLLSPAKNLNFDPMPSAPAATKPALSKDANALAGTAKGLGRGDLKRLMGISDNLADLNYERFQAFKTGGRISGAKQAGLAFNGDVYTGLDAASLSADDLAFAQDHLRILSGLYGLLRPLDAIQPYRLEMGTRLKTERGATLYDFWGDKIAKHINKSLKDAKTPAVVNLASNEYFKSVDKSALKHPVVTPAFKEEKDGKLRSLMLYAKQARGMMARWIIQNRVTRSEDLKTFSVAGYKLDKALSNETELVFTRPQPAKKAA
ncbi:MAG: peroxide stress protein YaaA [Pseudomonadota bacterium]